MASIAARLEKKDKMEELASSLPKKYSDVYVEELAKKYEEDGGSNKE